MTAALPAARPAWQASCPGVTQICAMHMEAIRHSDSGTKLNSFMEVMYFKQFKNLCQSLYIYEIFENMHAKMETCILVVRSGFWTGIVWIVLSKALDNHLIISELNVHWSRIFLILITVTLWNRHLLVRKTRFTISQHFESANRAVRISAALRGHSDSKAMIVIVRCIDGVIECIDSAFLYFLEYKGSARPHNISEIFEHKDWIKFIGHASNRIDADQRLQFKTWARKADDALVKIDVVVNRLSESMSELIVFHPKQNIGRATCDHIALSNQVSVGGELSYNEAYVILVTIMKNREYARRSSEQVVTWMSRMHKIIEDQLKHQGVRIIETRCDSFIALATTRDAPHPASRAVLGASAIARAALAEEKAAIRSGVACGQATVAGFRCAQKGDVLLLFGDVANVAARLEQSGDAASVHVCGRTARSFAKEQGIACPPIEVCAKGRSRARGGGGA